jgi:Fur family ferric uptake transcriptional regulator
MSITGPDAVEQLREHGLQATAQRVAVLRAISSHPHVSADEVTDLVLSDIGAISRQAVYDALAALSANGLLRRIQTEGSAARYEDRVNDNHHHLLCRECDRVVDVDCVVGSAPCLSAADDQGYEIDEAQIAFWGRCPDCQARNVTSKLADDTTANGPRSHQPRPSTTTSSQPERSDIT